MFIALLVKLLYMQIKALRTGASVDFLLVVDLCGNFAHACAQPRWPACRYAHLALRASALSPGSHVIGRNDGPPYVNVAREERGIAFFSDSDKALGVC